MTKRTADLDPLRGWTKTGVARRGRTSRNDDSPPREVTLPERKSTIELGGEMLAVKRGTETVRMTADDLMLDQLIARCLNGKRFADFRELYTLVNVEEEADMRRASELSRYQRSKVRAAIKARITQYAAIAHCLLDAGLAVIGPDGVMRPASCG